MTVGELFRPRGYPSIPPEANPLHIAKEGLSSLPPLTTRNWSRVTGASALPTTGADAASQCREMVEWLMARGFFLIEGSNASR
jgi:hypothetical protein